MTLQNLIIGAVIIAVVFGLFRIAASMGGRSGSGSSSSQRGGPGGGSSGGSSDTQI